MKGEEKASIFFFKSPSYNKMRLSIISIRAIDGNIKLSSPLVTCSILRSEAGEDQHAKIASRPSGVFKELEAFAKKSWTSVLTQSSDAEIELCTLRTQIMEFGSCHRVVDTH